MVRPSAWKQTAWLGGVVLVVAFASCRDFDAAYSQCVDAGLCGPGTGEDGGNTDTDGGNTDTDGGNTDGGNTDTDGGNTGTDGGGTGTDGGGNPGTDGGGNPGTDGGSNPGTDGGSNPGTDGGSNPGTDGGSNPGTDGGSNPGTDGGGLPGMDAGVDGGPNPADELNPGECNTLFCLLDRLTNTPSSSGMGFTGLWGSGPYDVFLAYGAQEVIRYDGEFTSTSLSALNNARPARLHGSGPDNVWGINETGVGPMPCSQFGIGLVAAPSGLAPDGGICPSPLVRYEQGDWSSATAPGSGPSIRPPALLTVAPGSTWVANDRGGALYWNGATWTEEPALTPDAGFIHAMWMGDAGVPEFGVGRMTASAGFAAYWLRESTGTWKGPQQATSSPPLFGIALEAIAGPGVDDLYAVGGQAVLRWRPASSEWILEPMPSLPTGCQLDSAQDVWVSADGSEVWVTFRSACALRKRNGTWSAVRLPVPFDFQALQVEGFVDSSSGSEVMNLWITGFQTSTGSAIAYRYGIVP